eukprot:RCo019935
MKYRRQEKRRRRDGTKIAAAVNPVDLLSSRAPVVMLLPIDVLALSFSWLLPDSLVHAGATCHHFRKIALLDSLWLAHMRTHLGVDRLPENLYPTAAEYYLSRLGFPQLLHGQMIVKLILSPELRCLHEVLRREGAQSKACCEIRASLPQWWCEAMAWRTCSKAQEFATESARARAALNYHAMAYHHFLPKMLMRLETELEGQSRRHRPRPVTIPLVLVRPEVLADRMVGLGAALFDGHCPWGLKVFASMDGFQAVWKAETDEMQTLQESMMRDYRQAGVARLKQKLRWFRHHVLTKWAH